MLCPTCQQEFADGFHSCPGDGSTLRLGSTTYSTRYREEHKRNPWKIAFLMLFVVDLAGAAAIAYFVVKTQGNPLKLIGEPPTPTAVSEKEQPGKPAAAEPGKTPPTDQAATQLAPLSREDLLKLVPKNLLRRFNAGESSDGAPGDQRVVSADGAEYVVLVGRGKVESQPKSSVARLQILKYDGKQFEDVTKKAVPLRYASGAVMGQRADARFNDNGANLTLREPASAETIIKECKTCEHAYQEVTLEWKGTVYVEKERVWENDRYTALYLAAVALEKRKVDKRSRPFINQLLDAEIARGFERDGATGWTVELRSGTSQSEKAEYEMSNGHDKLMIGLWKVKGQWRAVDIERGE